MTYAMIFPGQGSQKKGMGRDLFDRYGALVEEADQILGYSVRALCLEDPDQTLNQTQFTQPALFVVNAMAGQVLLTEMDGPPVFVAGHSLGEYNALVMAGALSFAHALELVKRRGALMAEARNGGMAAVIGMDAQTVQARINDHGLSGISVANQNTPVQTVVSGDRDSIAAAKPLFEAEKGVRYVVLKVSGAFHAPPMADAAADFAGEVARAAFRAPSIPVISNVLAAPYPEQGAGELLCRQMVSPVRWMDSVRYMQAQGVKTFVEAGPGRVLTKMLKDIQG